MRVQVLKGTNVAESLHRDSTNVTITTIFVNAEGNTVASESDELYDHKGSLIYVNGEITAIIRSAEAELHTNVTEVKELDGEIGEHECMKGTTIKVADYFPGKYTYNGSAWGTV